MPDRAPLTYEQLIDIQTRRLGDRDVMALLHDIKRVQGILLRLNQLRGELHRPPNVMAWVYDTMMAELDREPCVIASKRLSAELAEALKKDRKRR